jgi:hypothetical protein
MPRPEHFVRLVQKEEEFLDEFYGEAQSAAGLLAGDWTPNDAADDSTRRNQEYFRRRGELAELSFECAAVYKDADQRFSSVQIVLVSSARQVTVRVRRTEAGLRADIIVDRPTPS